VLRLLRQDNLLCLKQRPFVPVTTQSRHGRRVVPNLARGIELSGLDQFWVADITYIRLLEEFAYLAVVLNAFSRPRLHTREFPAGYSSAGCPPAEPASASPAWPLYTPVHTRHINRAGPTVPIFRVSP
jgi:hypothetical protein